MQPASTRRTVLARRGLALAGLMLLLAVCAAGCASAHVDSTPQTTSQPASASFDPFSEPHAYLCNQLLTPAPSEGDELGFNTALLGRNHVLDLTAVIDYAYCPPTSGAHYNIPGHGPIRPDVYPANEEQVPGGWVHNMEHGYIVALYRCPSAAIGQGDCISQSEMDQLQAFFDQAPAPPNPACPTKVVVARFDSMTSKFALLAWGRALLTDDFDLQTSLSFDEQYQDQPSVPEPGLC